jgi:hypothetical protein
VRTRIYSFSTADDSMPLVRGFEYKMTPSWDMRAG